MLLLTSVTDLLRITPSSANAVHVQASWVDNNAGTITPGRTNTVLTAAAIATVVASPAASTSRNVKQLTARAQGGANTLIVTHTDGTTPVELISVAVPSGGTLVFTDGLGFQVFNSSGQLLTQGTVGGTPAVVLGSAAAAGVSPNFLRTDDTIDAFDGVTPVNIAAAAVVGTNAFAAHSDHTHTIGAAVVTRAMHAADAVGWSFLGTATGATTTVGPVIWTGTFKQLMIRYWIQGYNGGTPVGRILLGVAAISTTALTNSFSISEGVTAPTTGLGATAIPGCPLAVTLSAIGRSGTIMVDGASGSIKSLEIVGRNVTPSVAAAPTLFRGVSFFSDLGTNLPILRAQLTVYDTLLAVAASAQTFTTGTYLTVWGRNND